MFKQREIFNILVSQRSLRQKKLHNKGNITREFDTGDVVVVRKQVKSTRNYRASQKIVFKTKRTITVTNTGSE